jgi:hypothetical protein
MNVAGISSVQDAFHHVVHDYGVAKLAKELGMSTGTLYNKANTNETSHHRPTLGEVVAIANITKDKRIAKAFARAVGGVFYSLPDTSDLSADALLLKITKTQAKGSDFYKTIHAALETDNKISHKEYDVIEHCAFLWIEEILETLAFIKEMSNVDQKHSEKSCSQRPNLSE